MDNPMAFEPTAAEAAAGSVAANAAHQAATTPAPTGSPAAIIDVADMEAPPNLPNTPPGSEEAAPATVGMGAIFALQQRRSPRVHAEDANDANDPATQINKDSSPATAGAGAGRSVRYELHPRSLSGRELGKGSKVGVSNFTKSTRNMAKEFDHDGDGEMSHAEIQQALRALRSTRRKNTRYALLLVASCVAIAVLVVLMGLASYWAVKTAQETSVSQDALVNKETGQPLQVASTEFKMSDDGTLVQRKHGEKNRDEAEAEPMEEVAIKTTAALTPSKLSSALPDSYFKELRSIEFKHPSGSAMYLDVTARARVMKTKSALGSVVKLVTPVGTVIIDSEIVSFSNDVAPLMEEAGFVVHPEVTSSGRRLLGGATVVGWFNMLADYTKAKPALKNSKAFPESDYSVTMTKLMQCTANDEECYDLEVDYDEVQTEEAPPFDLADVVDNGDGTGTVMIDGVLTPVYLHKHSCPDLQGPRQRNGYPIKYGVVTIDDVDYRKLVQRVHVKTMTDGSIVTRTETYLDRFPGHQEVTLERLVDGEKQTQTFQLYNNTRFYCTDGSETVAQGSFKVPDVENYGIAAPAGDRRLLTHVLGRRVPVAPAATAAATSPEEVLAGHEADPFKHQRRTEEAAAAGEEPASGDAVLPNLDADGNVITYETGPLTVTYDGLWCIDSDEAATAGCSSPEHELRRYTLSFDSSILQGMGLGVVHMYDDGEQPRRVEQPQVATSISIGAIEPLDESLEESDFEMEPCPAEEEQFVAAPPSMHGALTGDCVEPNELWSQAHMREGLRRLVSRMQGEVVEHAERRLVEHRRRHGANATLSPRELLDLNIEVNVGVCSFGATVTVDESNILTTPSFEIYITCTGKLYIISLTGSISLTYDGATNDVVVTGEIVGSVAADLSKYLGPKLQETLAMLQQAQMPAGVSIDWNDPKLEGSIKASLTWSGAKTMIDTSKGSCKEHYALPGPVPRTCFWFWGYYVCVASPKNAFYNGDHLVFRGKLEFTVGLTVTAGVSGFIAGAEFRVAGSAQVTVNTAFTRINKCWKTSSGEARTGVADGFATVTTATTKFSISGGVYMILPSAEVLNEIADGFSDALGAATDLHGAVSDLVGSAAGAVNSGVNEVKCFFGGCSQPQSHLSSTAVGQAALEAWYALDRICFQHAATPSADTSTVLTAAVITLYKRLEAKRGGTRIGDLWRSKMMNSDPRVNDDTWTRCPSDVVYDFERRKWRGLQFSLNRILTSAVPAIEASGPVRWKGGNRLVLDNSLTVAAIQSAYALDALSWNMVRQLAPWTDEQVAALEAAVNDFYTAIDKQIVAGYSFSGSGLFGHRTEVWRHLGDVGDKWFDPPNVKPFMRTTAAATIIVRYTWDWTKAQAFAVVKTNLGIHQQDGRVPKTLHTEQALRDMFVAGYDMDIAVWNAAAASLPGNDATAEANGYSAADGDTVNEAVLRFFQGMQTKSVDMWPNMRLGDVADHWWPWMESNVRTGAVQVAIDQMSTWRRAHVTEWQAAVKALIPDLRAMMQPDGERRLLDTAHTGPAPRPEFHGGVTLAARMLKRHLITSETELWRMPELSYVKTFALYPWGTGGATCEDPDGRTSVTDVFKIRANVMRDGHQTMAVIPSPFGGKCVADWSQSSHTAESSLFGNSVLGYFLEPVPDVF